MRPVVLESPYSGDIERNVRYAERCVVDSLRRGDAAIAQHLVYPRVSGVYVVDSENTLVTREYAFEAIEAIRDVVRFTVFYVDYGWSSGMLEAKRRCEEKGLEWEERKIGVNVVYPPGVTPAAASALRDLPDNVNMQPL